MCISKYIINLYVVAGTGACILDIGFVCEVHVCVCVCARKCVSACVHICVGARAGLLLRPSKT